MPENTPEEKAEKQRALTLFRRKRSPEEEEAFWREQRARTD